MQKRKRDIDSWNTFLHHPANTNIQAAAKYLATALRPKLEMGIFDALAFKGGTRVKSPGREKQSGRSWAPQDLPPGRSYQWPTVALEEAFSESREQVKQDVV
ncbi:hypothetical protein I7I51_04230 [Histoplasma capsulatum]|uniref:Uncharacterized protein n=1 Tax=Ajellomyces capsulatus TaxID=5037 RepID=A0A8A1MBF7_AJECA|nr:predicted protein [Histoplasma mississippiense (nom. inval.)]EDN07844.1 predicted protein [Histoplasma mississippiense (nom. inval.)]QSS62053.1 hypothetical protein I7I51_04230 [Histoplasma capsulatum]